MSSEMPVAARRHYDTSNADEAVSKVASIEIDASQSAKPEGFCAVGSRPIHRMAAAFGAGEKEKR